MCSAPRPERSDTHQVYCGASETQWHIILRLSHTNQASRGKPRQAWTRRVVELTFRSQEMYFTTAIYPSHILCETLSQNGSWEKQRRDILCDSHTNQAHDKPRQARGWRAGYLPKKHVPPNTWTLNDVDNFSECHLCLDIFKWQLSLTSQYHLCVSCLKTSQCHHLSLPLSLSRVTSLLSVSCPLNLFSVSSLSLSCLCKCL